ncbi:DUF3025 domain-containing protein [Alteromonas sediminis]|uniref:DUF3025 domain-containing protein n=1 Tax=Alteromonas sediminis TaxID=2259342 RepID=A0A3N5YAA9_9ALTE|nr:DUF3025 domain-containing protein [Alteromonas sediminis]RPJ68439.1 DUF3025 domain-containing protein [Alteromonas sediminis]
MVDQWQPALLSKIPCQLTADFISQVGMESCTAFPSAIQLNQMLVASQPDTDYQFIVQDHRCENDYYENIIAKKRRIPTRTDNWHDLLNALIWMQFPQSKALISQLHAKDIDNYGLHPRSARRNRLTHFDECGIVLVCAKSQVDKINPMLLALATHDWHSAFTLHKALWHKRVFPVLFGHAMLEMFLSPFIGMTAKWLAIVVDDEVFEVNDCEKRRQIDTALKQKIQVFDGFADKDILRPLPVLGVPHWCDNQNETFYANSAYFRPQRKGVVLTKQYPLS